MALSYERLKAVAPEHTIAYINKLLSYEDYARTHHVNYPNTPLFAGHYGLKRTDEKFMVTISALGEFDDYLREISKYDFDKRKYGLKLGDCLNPEVLYEKYSYLFPDYKDESLYYLLNPWDIVLHNYSDNLSCVDDILPRTTRYIFQNILNELSAKEKQKLCKKEEEQIYKNLPASTINYLETAARIRAFILSKKQYKKDTIIRNIDEDIVPISLLLAIFYCTKTKSKNIETTTNEELMADILKEKGLTSGTILRKLGIEMPVYELHNNQSEVVFAIKTLYKKMYELGSSNTQNLVVTQVTPRVILERLGKRQYTNSIAVEKILHELGFDKSILNFTDDELKNIREKSKLALEEQSKTEVYEKLKIPTIEFLETASKVYKLINKKIEETKDYNTKMIGTKNDITILSLLITSYFYENDLSIFLQDNQITLEKVQDLLNIKFTKEEIDATAADFSVIPDIFRKFIDSGTNSEKTNITINDICRNLCDREFTESKLIENLFSKLNEDYVLNPNFSSQLADHLKAKEVARKKELSNKLFQDLDPSIINILEYSSYIYSFAKRCKKDISETEAAAVSLLISFLYLADNEKVKMLNKNGITESIIVNYFEIKGNFSRDTKNKDLDIIDKHLMDFVLKGFSEGKERKDITQFDLLKNIFSKELNNSVLFNRFLIDNCDKADEFQDMDKLYSNYLEQKKKEDISNEALSIIQAQNIDVINCIRDAIGVYQYIKYKQKDLPNQNSFFENDDEIVLLSLILSLARNDQYSTTYHYLKKNNLSAENILKICNINDKNLLSFLDKNNTVYYSLMEEIHEEIDYSILFSHYDGLLDKQTPVHFISTIIKTRFNEDNPFLIKLASRANIDYNRIKREVVMGDDYEKTLTINDQIQILRKTEVEPVSVENIESVLQYGDDLLPHSKYIYEAMPKLLEVDETSKTISEVTKVLDGLYIRPQPQEKTTGIISRFFSSQQPVVAEANEGEIRLDKEKIVTLKNIINDYVNILKKELLDYNQIRVYIEEYCKKNSLCYQQAAKAIASLEEGKESLDKSNEDDYFRLINANTVLSIINDRANRFAASNLLMKKELLRVNQSIVDHFITLNSLEMARDTLIPLIETELAIAKGNDTERQAISLCQTVMGLFQALLTRNTDGTLENIERLKASSIPPEFVASINKDIELHMIGMEQVRSINEKIDTISDDKQKQLTKEVII